MRRHAALEFAMQTDTGLVRSQNEDAIAVSPTHGFAVLADGMGGYNAGEVASSMAVEVVKQFLDTAFARMQRHSLNLPLRRERRVQQLMVEAVRRANEAVLDAAAAEPRFSGMGTTLVAAVFHGKTLTIAHVGDSRAYRMRNGELVQLTRDHSLLQEQIDAGLLSVESARLSEYRNLVTRAVGVISDLEVEVHDHGVQSEDIYMLCSDGLSDMLTDAEIAGAIKASRSSLHEACAALIRLANASGGRDNISVILIRAPVLRRAGALLRKLLH